MEIFIFFGIAIFVFLALYLSDRSKYIKIPEHEYKTLIKRIENETKQLKTEYTEKEAQLLKKIEQKENELKTREENLQHAITKAKNEIEEKNTYFTNLKENYQKSVLENIKKYELNFLQNKAQSQKWLSTMIADFMTIALREEIDILNNSRSEQKHERAIKITDLKTQIKQLLERNKILEYELKYLYDLYPSLEDKELELEEEVIENPLEGSDWLTKEEWETLSDLEKNTLAFERYKNRHKTKWQIGRDFEMYIGYKCEHDKNYEVTYNGIELKYADMGIDLIAKKGNETLLIQCKYWSSKKTIHEKHLCQLYGTSYKYQIEHPDESVIPVFVCHNRLSQVALDFANKLGIEVHQNVELGDYPAIKCCDNERNETFIFYLPFDLGYDEIKNCTKHFTVEEVMKLGYRRRYKWHNSL